MGDALTTIAGVAFGGAIGAPLRFALSGLVGRRVGETFPWGTMAVNASGAFAIGIFAAIVVQTGNSLWLFVVTGILGSYTTVSSFSLQTLALAGEGSTGRAAANAALSLGLCLGAVTCGHALGSWISHG